VASASFTGLERLLQERHLGDELNRRILHAEGGGIVRSELDLHHKSLLPGLAEPAAGAVLPLMSRFLLCALARDTFLRRHYFVLFTILFVRQTNQTALGWLGRE
jgi:hypothetical protein